MVADLEYWQTWGVKRHMYLQSVILFVDDTLCKLDKDWLLIFSSSPGYER